MEYKNKRRLIAGISIFLLLILYLLKNYSLTIRITGFIFGLIIFYLIDHLFSIKFKLRHYFYILIILFFGILLSPLYFLSENYDKILHFVSPIFGSFLIFYIINKQKLSFQWKLLITFMFIISFLAIHEMGEYLIDFFWDFKLQGVYLRDTSGLNKLDLVLPKNDDTMIDMLIGTMGAIIFLIGKTITSFWKRKN